MTTIKPVSSLRFDHNPEEHWYEFSLYEDEGATGVIEQTYVAKGRRNQGWDVVLYGLSNHPVFHGTFLDCKRFVNLMWESLR